MNGWEKKNWVSEKNEDHKHCQLIMSSSKDQKSFNARVSPKLFTYTNQSNKLFKTYTSQICSNISP